MFASPIVDVVNMYVSWHHYVEVVPGSKSISRGGVKHIANSLDGKPGLTRSNRAQVATRPFRSPFRENPVSGRHPIRKRKLGLPSLDRHTRFDPRWP
ncbi:MAG: hypothetical protein Q6370_016710, partial [Candidatus Sigynarchaeota archaeon]